MVSKDLFKKVLVISSASILAVSMPTMTVLANEGVEETVKVDGSSSQLEVTVESITVDEGQSAIVVSAPNAEVTVTGDVTSSGTSGQYSDPINNEIKYNTSKDAVIASAGGVTINGNLNANGDEQKGVNAYGSGTDVTVKGQISANGSGINASSGATVTAGSVNSAGDAIVTYGEASVTVNGNAYSSGMKEYNSTWDEEKGAWVVVGETYRGTGLSTDGSSDVIIDGNLQGYTEGINVHRDTPDTKGSIVVTGKVSVASENGTRIYIGNSYNNENKTVTYETTQDVLNSIPDIYLYELDKPYIYVGREPEDGSSATAQITEKVIESINYIIKKDSLPDATITSEDGSSAIGALTVNGTDYSTVNINKAFKVAASLEDGYTLSGGNNVSVVDNGDGTFTLTLLNSMGGINIKAVAIVRPAPASDSSSDDSGEKYEVVVQEVTPADENPSQAPAGAIVVANTVAAEAPASVAAISGDKPARTVSYSIANISPIQYKTSIIENVAAAPAGGAFNIETDRVACFDTKMIEAISARSDIDVNVVFTYGGKKLKVTIPAGYDVRSLLDANGYCGFLRLMAILGASEL